MDICILGSGSSGNSFFISNNEYSILIDAGFSYKELNRRLSKIGKDINEIKAVFISHEHTDHIKGAEKLYKEKIFVFMNKATYEFSNLNIKPVFFETNNEFNFLNFKIKPFRQEHDAIDPCGFQISDDITNKSYREYNKENSRVKTISVMTDFGKPNQNNLQALKESDAVLLESNHDIDMLINGPYPYDLKQRILGNKGHLSNVDAGLFVKENSTEKLKNVVLCHLSKVNNKHEVAYDTFMQITNKKFKTYVSNQYAPTEIIKV